MNRSLKRTGQIVGAAAAVAAASYGALIAWAWTRHGQASRGTPEDADALLDRFMPLYDVAERHRVRVRAPADVTLAAAADMNLQQSGLVRAIFRTRELGMGSSTIRPAAPQGLLAQVKAFGWGVLAETPGREIVMGAVTQPWKADVVFRAVPPSEFASFAEPGYVKIAWTLRADPLGPSESIFRTQTRVVATDAIARARFRRYWAFVSPGIRLIRRLVLSPLKSEAEHRARRAVASVVATQPR